MKRQIYKDKDKDKDKPFPTKNRSYGRVCLGVGVLGLREVF